jgi:hypothetical protein
MLSSTFKQDVRSVYVCVRELIRVAEAEVDVRLRSEVEDGVDLVFAKHPLYVGRRCDVTILECEVGLIVKDARVVECRAVVQLVEGDYVVVLGVCEDEMADEPAGSMDVSACKTFKYILFVYAFSNALART